MSLINLTESEPPMSVKCEEPVKDTASRLPSVIFVHGKESGPNGEKIVALAEVAKKHGYQTQSPDFRGIECLDERVMLLLKTVSEMETPFIFVGSSMGAYVSIVASTKIETSGLFLLAPAVGIPSYPIQYPVPGCRLVSIVHAWQDDIIPVTNAFNYAKEINAELHIVNSDHRLSKQIPFLKSLFELFLNNLSNSPV